MEYTSTDGNLNLGNKDLEIKQEEGEENKKFFILKVKHVYRKEIEKEKELAEEFFYMFSVYEKDICENIIFDVNKLLNLLGAKTDNNTLKEADIFEVENSDIHKPPFKKDMIIWEEPDTPEIVE